MPLQNYLDKIKKEKKLYFFVFAVAAIILLGVGISPPGNFPKNSIITIPEGQGLLTLSQNLKNQDVIRSPFWFRFAAIILRGERKMKAGEYYLKSPESSFVIAWRIYQGEYEVETEKITIPEGFTVKKISTLFDGKFTKFNHSYFEAFAPEGYLFPDTYFIPITATGSSTIKLLKDNFIRKIFSVMPEVEQSGKSLSDIITMASLLEAEAKTPADRAIVSDILWKRLKLGMALQVDSDMGTYNFNGLPKNPIDNPGLVSIEAALHPTKTQYLYFLTGKDGQMHYAKTFDEHQANIQKYL